MKFLSRPLNPTERMRMGLIKPVCDFCGGQNPITVFAAKVMSTGIRVRCWRWTACAVCDHDIQNSRWGSLFSRTYEVTAKELAAGSSFNPNSTIDQIQLFDSVRMTYEDFLMEVIREDE